MANPRARALTVTMALIALLAILPTAAAAAHSPSARGRPRESAFTRSLTAGMREAGSSSGAEVVDLTTGRTLFSDRASVGRLPASVEKLYTTSTLLDTFGAGARLATTVLGRGRRSGSTWRGTLYLRGGGDPTFGSAGFDHTAYGTGATVQGLAAQLRAQGVRTINGSVVADASLFDDDEGTVATDNRPSIYVEGALSALAFDRGWADDDGTVYASHPALQAADALIGALRAAHIRVLTGRVRLGVTPVQATTLATVRSPTIATLIQLTNTPSDNFFAEMLLKSLGARYGAGGTTADGAAVVRRVIAQRFGLRPQLDDGSGLSYFDHTSPAQVISLLTEQQHDAPFRDSLAILGRTGTLADENVGTVAEGRCTGKTGTLHAVSNVVGYCTAADGDTLAYAFLMNGVDPDAAHLVQDAMEIALVRYPG